jgi:CheY-like chemotaxis protein
MIDDQAEPCVLVASATSQFVRPHLQNGLGLPVLCVATAAELDTVLNKGPQIRLAFVDCFWNDSAAEWNFDGLDVIDRIKNTGCTVPVVMALRGSYAEFDLLDEATERGDFAATVRKSAGPAEALRIGAAVMNRTPVRLFAPGTPISPSPSVHKFLSGRDLVAHVAGSIASGGVHDFGDIAQATGFARRSVEATTALFGNALCLRGELSDPQQCKQATVFRWCGEHAHYILSWTRRHGLPYRRVMST